MRCNYLPLPLMPVSGTQALISSIKCDKYRQVSNIRCIKSQHFIDSRTVLRLSLPNPLKPDVKTRMKMQLEQRRQALLQLHLNDRQFYCLLRWILYWRFYGKRGWYRGDEPTQDFVSLATFRLSCCRDCQFCQLPYANSVWICKMWLV